MINRLMTPIERASVEELRGNTRDKDAYMKLSVLVMLDEGKSYEEISVLLGLSRGSIANCRKKFGEEGLDKYLDRHYVPYQGKLNECQLSALEGLVSSGIYTTSGEIQAYIEREFGVSYSLSAVRLILHKLDFVYKKTSDVPGGLDEAEQEALPLCAGYNNHIFYSGFPGGTIFTQITRGIFLSNSDKCFLRDNEIRATDGSLIGTSMHGIELLGSERCTLCCNLTDATTVGNFFMGNCDPTYLRHEQLYNHWVGLDCRDVGTVVGDQDWAGNQWLGTYGMLGAWHTGSTPNILNSEFRVELPDTPPFWPPSRDPDPNIDPNDIEWFISSENGASQNCAAADALCPNLPPPAAPNDPRDLTENERRIANGTYVSTHVYDQTTQREDERSLYREMKTNTSLSGQDAFVDQFFTSASTSAIGQLYDVESQLQGLGALPENDRTRLLQIVNTLDSLAQVRDQIDLLYASAQNAADSTALSNWKTSCFSAAHPLLEEWLEIHDNAEASLHSQIPGIISLNNSITASNTWVANRKTVNRIYLETIASGFDEDIQRLRSEIAAWKHEYLVVAPIDGKVAFSKIWSIHQSIDHGQEIMAVIPFGTSDQEANIIGKAILSGDNIGEIMQGSRAIIHLDAYPVQQYGALEGVVTNIGAIPYGTVANINKSTVTTPTPQKKGYQIDIELPNTLLTTYGKLIPFRQEMGGKVRVIADDRRLIERIFDKLYDILENK